MNIKRKLAATAALTLGLGLYTQLAHAVNPVEATITVTPVANLSLAIAPTTYAFGSLDVSASSVSATALVLSNDGEVGVSVNKQITVESAPAGWTAGAAVGADTYTLHVASSAARPADGDFAASHLYGAQSNSTPLTGTGGTSTTLAVSATADLWFRLGMPDSISNTTAREITVDFTASAL